MKNSDDNSKAGRPLTEWDAASYHRLSAPQFSWGLQVLERFRLDGGETVLDAGCGTGRLTAGLLERAGFRVTQAACGRDCLKLVEGGERFDLYLLDHTLHVASLIEKK